MSGELILIVEDDADSRTLVRDILNYNGFRTVESESAEHGLRLAEEHLPSLILMDIHLPGMSGIEALNELRATSRTNGIPVVAVTASVLSEQQENVMKAGFDAFERKPLVLKGFIERIRALLSAAGRDGGEP